MDFYFVQLPLGSFLANYSLDLFSQLLWAGFSQLLFNFSQLVWAGLNQYVNMFLVSRAVVGVPFF